MAFSGTIHIDPENQKVISAAARATKKIYVFVHAFGTILLKFHNPGTSSLNFATGVACCAWYAVHDDTLVARG